MIESIVKEMMKIKDWKGTKSRKKKSKKKRRKKRGTTNAKKLMIEGMCETKNKGKKSKKRRRRNIKQNWRENTPKRSKDKKVWNTMSFIIYDRAFS